MYECQPLESGDDDEDVLDNTAPDLERAPAVGRCRLTLLNPI